MGELIELADYRQAHALAVNDNPSEDLMREPGDVIKLSDYANSLAGIGRQAEDSMLAAGDELELLNNELAECNASLDELEIEHASPTVLAAASVNCANIIRQINELSAANNALFEQQANRIAVAATAEDNPVGLLRWVLNARWPGLDVGNEAADTLQAYVNSVEKGGSPVAVLGAGHAALTLGVSHNRPKVAWNYNDGTFDRKSRLSLWLNMVRLSGVVNPLSGDSETGLWQYEGTDPASVEVLQQMIALRMTSQIQRVMQNRHLELGTHPSLLTGPDYMLKTHIYNNFRIGQPWVIYGKPAVTGLLKHLHSIAPIQPNSNIIYSKDEVLAGGLSVGIDPAHITTESITSVKKRLTAVFLGNLTSSVTTLLRDVETTINTPRGNANGPMWGIMESPYVAYLMENSSAGIASAAQAGIANFFFERSEGRNSHGLGNTLLSDQAAMQAAISLIRSRYGLELSAGDIEGAKPIDGEAINLANGNGKLIPFRFGDAG